MNKEIAVGNNFQVEWRNFEPRLFFQGQLSFETVLDLEKTGTPADYESIGRALIESILDQKDRWITQGSINLMSADDLFKGIDLL